MIQKLTQDLHGLLLDDKLSEKDVDFIITNVEKYNIKNIDQIYLIQKPSELRERFTLIRELVEIGLGGYKIVKLPSILFLDEDYSEEHVHTMRIAPDIKKIIKSVKADYEKNCIACIGTQYWDGEEDKYLQNISLIIYRPFNVSI